MEEQTLKDTFTFTLDGKDITITMYAGVLNKALVAIGGLNGCDTLPVDSEKQSALVKTLLTKYNNKGEETGVYADAFMLPLDIHQDILDWGFQHCINFIQKTATKMVKTIDKGAKELAKDSRPSTAG